MALDLATLERQRHERIHAKVFHVGLSVDGPRADAIPADRLPTHTVGSRSVPSSCGHCGGRLLSVEPPMGAHPRGQVSCATCGRQLCWLAAPSTGPRFPVATGPVRPVATMPARHAASPPVRLRGFVRTLGCGTACSDQTGHDAPTHERYGAEQAMAAQAQRVVRTGPLVIDLAACTVEVNGDPKHVSEREWGLLACLARRPGQLVSHQQVLAEVWGDAWALSDTGYLNNVRSQLNRLRARLGPDGASMIESRMSQGLLLHVVEPGAAAPTAKRLIGRWSRKYDACISCKSDRFPHSARGMCTGCYSAQAKRSDQ